KLLIGLFLVQIILNVIWNPIFFKYQQVFTALIVISLLTVVVSIFFLGFISELKFKAVLLLPYLIWLLIATSLNFYILQYN
ncbi:MAG: tryptophan-rich sensory protein, partial [Flammeovirgaceae bacterium]|nr:tryptophan-rich sensory protein [Flammeovirgaceae bacterium]